MFLSVYLLTQIIKCVYVNFLEKPRVKIIEVRKREIIQHNRTPLL